MHVARDRRRAYLGIPDAGNQCRAALPGANTRSACRTAAVRPRRGRLFLRRRVRGTFPKRRRRWCGNSARISARGGSRPRPTCWGCPGVVRPRRRRGLHPRHGPNSCWCRGGEIVENVPPLGYVLGDEGSGAALGRNLVNGIFKGHIPPAGGVPRGAWADL